MTPALGMYSMYKTAAYFCTLGLDAYHMYDTSMYVTSHTGEYCCTCTRRSELDPAVRINRSDVSPMYRSLDMKVKVACRSKVHR